MSEWHTVALTDALEFREGPGILAKDFRDQGVPLIRLAGLKAGASLLSGCNYLDPGMVASKWSHFQLQLGDVLLSTSASLGEVAQVDESGVGAVPYTGIIGFRPVSEQHVAPEFIRFALTSPTFKQQVEAMGVGSVMKHFGPSHLRHMTVDLPPIREQKAISEVLGALDGKIVANTAQAKAADALVRGLFRELEVGAASLSVASIVQQSKRLIDPSTASGGTGYVGLEHLPRRLMWLNGIGDSASVASSKWGFEKGDILFGKLRPYFHKVASAPGTGICSTDILVLRPKEQELAGFALAALSSDRVIERCTSASEGTRMPRTRWKDLASVEVPWPGQRAALMLSAVVVRLRDAVEARMRENAMVTELRDTLLPQLMSGRLRVRDAERVVEGVV